MHFNFINQFHGTANSVQIFGDFTHIAPGATLSGGVEIGNGVLIGAGANIIQYKRITDDTIIGAGAIVIRDINKPGIYMGNPARENN